MAAGLLAGCSPHALHASPPAPSNVARELCAGLGDQLPTSLHDGSRALGSRVLTPQSPLTHAWGDPPVVLRCGVPTPPGYSSSASLTEVDGVSWFQAIGGSTVVWTALRKGVNVELRIPTTYEGQGALLADLAPAVSRGLPS